MAVGRPPSGRLSELADASVTGFIVVLCGLGRSRNEKLKAQWRSISSWVTSETALLVGLLMNPEAAGAEEEER